MRGRGASGVSCLIAVDKPYGLTSQDAVSSVRRSLGERRVGHAGTLDPLATGVLVVGIGQATRLLGRLTLDVKSYEASIVFGEETSTDDAEGEVIRTASIPSKATDSAWAAQKLTSLVGVHEQVPPAYSAISIKGQRAYRIARSGGEVELPARPIQILDARLLSVEEGGQLCWRCFFTVSKGTYIRAIARDLGRELGSAAHLAALRRTSSGSIGLKQCITLDEVDGFGVSGIESHALDPVAILDLPRRILTDAESARAAHGQPLSLGDASPSTEEAVALVHDGRLMGIWRRDNDHLRCDINLPQGVGGVRS